MWLNSAKQQRPPSQASSNDQESGKYVRVLQLQFEIKIASEAMSSTSGDGDDESVANVEGRCGLRTVRAFHFSKFPFVFVFSTTQHLWQLSNFQAPLVTTLEVLPRTLANHSFYYSHWEKMRLRTPVSSSILLQVLQI